MTKKSAGMVLLAAAAVAGWGLAGYLAYRKPAAIVTPSCSITDESTPAPVPATDLDKPQHPVQTPKPVRKPPTVSLAVESVEADGERLYVRMNHMPDMRALRGYVTAGPLASGVLECGVENCYDDRFGSYRPTLVIKGDFAYRTNLVLRIAKGLPPAEGARALPMPAEYVHSFKRPDKPASVRFADSGRYLAPDGERALALACVNATNIEVTLASVPARNIVPLLALAEKRYAHTYTFDDADGHSATFAEAGEKTKLSVAGEPNAETRAIYRIRPMSGATNGVFAVTLNDAERRLVCVTDLGLSVRQTDKGLYAWTTSLVTGRPYADVRYTAYSPANIPVAEGHADATGRCALRRIAEGEAFVIVAERDDGSDRTFVSLTDDNEADERRTGAAPMSSGSLDAFLYTERGIYRHGETIYVQALVRDDKGRAPKPLPLVLTLTDPADRCVARKTVMTDALGAIACGDLSATAESPSGRWRVKLATPGQNGRCLAERTVSVEAFVPPQIRSSVDVAADVSGSSVPFSVSAEHLFGGAASGLRTSAVLAFKPVPFEPKGFPGWTFAEAPQEWPVLYAHPEARYLGEDGRASFEADVPRPDRGDARPGAALSVAIQASVMEDGGRSAVTEKKTLFHPYPFYIGTRAESVLVRAADGRLRIPVACVTPAGVRRPAATRLETKLARIVTTGVYRKGAHDEWGRWETDRIREIVRTGSVTVPAGKDGEVALDGLEAGDWALVLRDPESDSTRDFVFRLCGAGDTVRTAPSTMPTALSFDGLKNVYRPGEKPAFVVRAPFAGTALVSVFHDDLVWWDVVAFTNAAARVELPAVTAAWAPNVDVCVSVVRPGDDACGHAVRAHGRTVLAVRPPETELTVDLGATRVDPGTGGTGAVIRAVARVTGNTGMTRVVFTAVDAGILMLTSEKTPDPVGRFGRIRRRAGDLYDVHGRLLPVIGLSERATVKTGGGADGLLLGRLSPVPSRRFKPFARVIADVPVVDGRAEAAFPVADFIGSVRIAAVAYTDAAAGAAAVTRPVAPKLVTQPDAPRFAAPGDVFDATLPIRNRADAAGPVSYAVSVSGGTLTGTGAGTIVLPVGGSTNLTFRVKALEPGEITLVFTARGFGEERTVELFVPVRPAVAWETRAGTFRLDPGEAREWQESGVVDAVFRPSPSRFAELAPAFDWLADYPHGCLEQTSARAFPLLNAIAVSGSCAANADATIRAALARIRSMARWDNFSMWPDADYEPWDPDVTLFAAHFVAEASRAGYEVAPDLLKTCRRATDARMNANHDVIAYACLVRALTGPLPLGAMYRLYDDLAKLSPLARARLAYAFATAGDAARAQYVLESAEAPADVKTASFRLMALLALDASDARIPALASYLEARRDAFRSCWGTTAENAHALWALGAYYARNAGRPGAPDIRVGGVSVPTGSVYRCSGAVPATFANKGAGTAFVTWRARALPAIGDVKDESTALAVSVRYLTPEGKPADLAHVVRGDMLVAELALTSSVKRVYNDLVIEHLLPAAFEPVLGGLEAIPGDWADPDAHDWLIRSEARDDRLLAYSKRFTMEKNDAVVFRYPVRVVSAGDFVLPGPSVEGMYDPALRARRAHGRVVVVR